MKNGLIVCAVLLAATACGSSDSPSTPSIASVAGNWAGSMSYTFKNNAGTPVQGIDASFSMSLTQSGTSVSGTWKSPLSDGTTRSGTVGGTLTTTSFSGAFTYHRTLTDGTNCDGTLTVSGPAGGNSLTWTSPGVIENCGNPDTNITITVVKQ